MLGLLVKIRRSPKMLCSQPKLSIKFRQHGLSGNCLEPNNTKLPAHNVTSLFLASLPLCFSPLTSSLLAPCLSIDCRSGSLFPPSNDLSLCPWIGLYRTSLDASVVARLLLQPFPWCKSPVVSSQHPRFLRTPALGLY
jgi:hypothetical protein